MKHEQAPHNPNPLIDPLLPVIQGQALIASVNLGLFAAICRKHPPMRGDVLELPETMEEAKEIAFLEGTTGVVTHIEGNVLTDDLQGPYDVVFLANLIHHLSPEQNRAVFQKIAGVLNPGGIIAVWDVRDSGTEDDITAASFSLFFYLTSGTACCTREEIEGRLISAGFHDIQVHNSPGSSTHMLITGRKR